MSTDDDEHNIMHFVTGLFGKEQKEVLFGKEQKEETALLIHDPRSVPSHGNTD